MADGETWLVCGGRDFDDATMFNNAMQEVARIRGLPRKIVHGGAAGADTMATAWGDHYNIEVEIFVADWPKHGRAAGPIRNQQMLDEARPDFVIAFPGGKGTADMISRAKKAGIPLSKSYDRGSAHHSDLV